ncbi:MAG: nitrogen fixation protein NifQ [Hyphomicrobiales bacterium]|nr:nitrogen fixation protein NifQ [Hyphomicrobiales bacterium]
MARVRHARLMRTALGEADADRRFDDHVLACVLSVGLEEAGQGTATVAGATGLAASELALLLATRFPAFDRAGLGDAEIAPVLEAEEVMLRDLLLDHAATDLAPLLARVIARRALRPDHLWQDLGLFDRSELNRLLARHFPTLHAGNAANMRWKKYFYRRLCEAEGFSLCSAPSCAQCADFAECFGAEDGESRMAERRRALDRADVAALAAE